MKVNFSILKKYDLIEIRTNETVPYLKKDIKILLIENPNSNELIGISLNHLMDNEVQNKISFKIRIPLTAIRDFEMLSPNILLYLVNIDNSYIMDAVLNRVKNADL